MGSIGGFDVGQIVTLAIVVMGVVGTASFARPLLRRARRSNRVKTVVLRRRGELSRQQMEALAQSGQLRKPKESVYVNLAQTIAQKLRLTNILSSDEVKVFLAQGGFRGRTAVPVYASTRLILAIVGIIAVVLVLKVYEDKNYSAMAQFGMWIGGAVVGFYLPKLMVSNHAQRRQQEMGKVFPDAMDLLVICVEAGLGIEAAFDRVTQELGESSPILAQEMGLATAELAFLGDRRKAYQNFADRTGLPAIAALATALGQSEKYGTPVSVALKVLSQEKRHERMSAAEKKAAALPAQLTVPMIVFFLPVLFLVVLGPTVIQLIRMD